SENVSCYSRNYNLSLHDALPIYAAGRSVLHGYAGVVGLAGERQAKILAHLLCADGIGDASEGSRRTFFGWPRGGGVFVRGWRTTTHSQDSLDSWHPVVLRHGTAMVRGGSDAKSRFLSRIYCRA